MSFILGKDGHCRSFPVVLVWFVEALKVKISNGDSTVNAAIHADLSILIPAFLK